MKQITANHLKEVFENFSWSQWYSTTESLQPNVLSSRHNLGILDYSTQTNKLRYIQHKNHYYIFNLSSGTIRVRAFIEQNETLIESPEYNIAYFSINNWNEMMVDIFQPDRAIVCYFNDFKSKYIHVEKLVSVNKSPMNEFNYNVQFTNGIMFSNVGLKTTLFKHYITLKTLKVKGKGQSINKIFDESKIFNAPMSLLHKVFKLPVTIIDSNNQLGFCGHSMSSTTSELKEITIPFKIKKEHYSEIIWLIQDCLELGEVLSFVKNKITIRKTSTEYYD